MAEKKALQDGKRAKQVVDKKVEVEEWPALGKGTVPAKNRKALAASGGNGFELRNAPATNGGIGLGARKDGSETNSRNDYSSRNRGMNGFGSTSYGRSEDNSRSYGRRDYGYRNHDRSDYVSRNDGGNNYGLGNMTETEDGKKHEMSQDERLALWGRVRDRRRRG